jgi:hypothetical protein
MKGDEHTVMGDTEHPVTYLFNNEERGNQGQHGSQDWLAEPGLFGVRASVSENVQERASHEWYRSELQRLLKVDKDGRIDGVTSRGGAHEGLRRVLHCVRDGG